MFNIYRHYFKLAAKRKKQKKTLKSLFLFFFFLASPALASEPVPVELQDVGLEEHLGEPISQDISFVNEDGKSVSLKNYFDGTHPVVLMMAYYTCPNICHYLLGGVDQTLKSLPMSFRENFEVVTVSINPKETYQDAITKKGQYIKGAEKKSEDGSKDGVTPNQSTGAQKISWHFLTGQEENIKKLANELGFKYRYDPAQKEYAHSAAIMVLTPDGRISRYLYGIQFRTLDFRLAILEAAQGKIGNIVDKILLFCYHYDPKGKKYALLAKRMMAGAGVLTVMGVIGFLALLMWKRKDRDIEKIDS